MATFIGNGLQSALVGRLWSYVNSELNRKAGSRIVYDSVRFFFLRKKKENNLLERHRWQFLTSDSRFKEYMGLQCHGNHELVWKQTSEGKREYPSATIRRLVNGFVHDLRPPQLRMFLSEADRILSSSPAVFVVHLLKKPRRIFHQWNVNVFES